MSNKISEYILNESFQALDSFLKEYQMDIDVSLNNNKNNKTCLCKFTLEEQNDKNEIYKNIEGYICCNNCGYVFQTENVDLTADYVTYEEERYSGADNARCQVPTKDCFGKEVFKTYISSKNSYKFINLYNSLNRLNLYSQSNPNITKTSNIRKVLNEYIGLFFSEVFINKIADEYMNLKKIYRADNRIAMLAALTYFICKEENVFKSIDWLSVQFQITTYQITTMIHKLSIEFKKYIDNNNENIYKQCDTLSKYIEYNQVILLKKIIKTVIDLNILLSYTPQTMISSCLYFLIKQLKLDIDINKISEIMTVSNGTISKNYNTLQSSKQKIFNYIKQNSKEFTFH